MQQTKTRPRPARPRPVEDDLAASLHATQDPRWAVPAIPADAISAPLGQLLTCPADNCDATGPCVHSGPAAPGHPDTGHAETAEPVTLSRPAATTAAEWRPPASAAPSPYYAPSAPQAVAPAEEDRPAEWRPMTVGQKLAGAVIAPPAAVLGAVGFAVSFRTVEARMAAAFGPQAWMVPAGLDLGILVFAALHIWLAAVGMRMGWLRVVPWGLTAATITLNATAYADPAARIAHTVLPSMWVVVCEITAHIVAVRTGMRRGEHSDPIPLIRWVLAPWPTLRLWRSMRMWGVRSYKLALAREEERILVITRLREAFGGGALIFWRHRVPPMLMIRYKLRKLTLADVEAALTVRAAETITATAVRPTPAEDAPAEPTADPGPAAESPAARPTVTAENRPAAKPTPAAARPSKSRPRTAVDLGPIFDRLAADLGHRPSGSALKDAAKAAGTPVGLTTAKDWMKAHRPITKGASA